MEWRHIEAARRMLASETGAIVRDWGGQIPLALAYPNTYAVGMSSLAIHALYRLFNDMPGVLCERAFASLSGRPAPDAPLLTLETQRPVRDVAILAFSISFEMDYFNIIQMLRRAQIPVHAEERGRYDPLVIFGGPAVSANPAPLAPAADAIVVGELEAIANDLVNCFPRSAGQRREKALAEISQVPGVYVPTLHEGERVQRQILEDLDAYPTATSIIAPEAEFGDMYLIEIARGCGWGCRFCLAGYWYRPPRQRSLGQILHQAKRGLKYRDKIGLVASAVSDYGEIEGLMTGLCDMGAKISVSSLRVKPLPPILVRALAESGAQSITLAPEAGSERLRQVIRKGITHDDIMEATELVAAHDFRTLKLYFMTGLPGETDQDIAALIQMVEEIAGRFSQHIVVNVTPFVPKAHTPFQRVAVCPRDILQARQERIERELHSRRTEIRAGGVLEAHTQATLARGDQRIGKALMAMETPTPGRWADALREQGLDWQMYLRERGEDEALPWDFIDAGTSPGLLQAEYRKSREMLETMPCCNVHVREETA
ncbi:MAG: radical SAM protein [Anaerolineales bacterium]